MAGNIRCSSDSNVPVIGFFEGCNIVEKRIFIDRMEVPEWKYYKDCGLVDVLNHPDSLKAFIANAQKYPLYWTNPSKTRVYAEKKECVDCSIIGSPVKPTYWPQ